MLLNVHGRMSVNGVNIENVMVLYNYALQDGCTPLMLHAESGNLDVVITLLEAHAFMDAQDKVQYVYKCKNH